MHARLKPRQHRFTYKVFSILLDLDRLGEAHEVSKVFSVNRRGLLSFHEADHGPKDGTKLRDYINTLACEAGVGEPRRIELWCNPRVLGYVFNPLSIYFCYDTQERICALVYQVHNTFGQSHCYVAKVNPETSKAASIRQSANKCFYVSPFLDMDLRYDFRIAKPDEALRIRILEHDSEGPILSATFSGTQKPFSTLNLLLGVKKTAGLTWKIMAGIHFEAAKLRLKGLKLRPRPKSAPSKPSIVSSQSKMVPGE